MLKSKDTILRPDLRHASERIVDPTTGLQRSVTIDDLYALIEPLNLSDAVPAVVRQQFDIARQVFLYSWFCYELVTAAEEFALGVVELALKLGINSKSTTKEIRGLKSHKVAFNSGWLRQEEFEMPSPGGGTISILEFIRMQRSFTSWRATSVAGRVAGHD